MSGTVGSVPSNLVGNKYDDQYNSHVVSDLNAHTAKQQTGLLAGRVGHADDDPALIRHIVEMQRLVGRIHELHTEVSALAADETVPFPVIKEKANEARPLSAQLILCRAALQKSSLDATLFEVEINIGLSQLKSIGLQVNDRCIASARDSRSMVSGSIPASVASAFSRREHEDRVKKWTASTVAVPKSTAKNIACRYSLCSTSLTYNGKRKGVLGSANYIGPTKRTIATDCDCSSGHFKPGRINGKFCRRW